jgi:hypothetical protein
MRRSPLFCALVAILLFAGSRATPIEDAIDHIDGMADKSAIALHIINNRFPVTYDLGSNAQLLKFARTELVTPVVFGNSKMGDSFPALGAVGTDLASNTRYAAWSSDPFRVSRTRPNERNIIMTALESIAWAVGDAAYNSTTASSTRTVSISFMSSDNSIWTAASSGVFALYFPNWTVNICNDVETLATCLQGATVHFAGGSLSNDDHDQVVSAFKTRLGLGYPYIYFHDAGWGDDVGGSSKVLGLSFPYAGIYFSPQSVNIASANEVTAFLENEYEFAAVRELLVRLRDSSFSWDINACTDETCSADVLYNTQVLSPVKQLKSMIASMENQALSPFDASVSPLLNKLVLVGDYLRQSTQYPINNTHSATVWSKAIVADGLYTQLRSSGSAQPNLGDFGKTIAPSVTRVDASRSFPTRRGSYHVSSGLFAAPGDTITIQRVDSYTLDDDVLIYINRIRYNTDPIERRFMNRPYWLYGNAIPLKLGNTITINSAYGGIIYVHVPTSTNRWHADVQIGFGNVVAHPVYVLNSGQSTTSWKNDISSGLFSWAEIHHPHLQIHLQEQRARNFIEDYGDNLASVFEDMETYLYNYHYKMAGFWSAESTIDPLASVLSKAESFGLRGMNVTSPQHELTDVQHMNSDVYSLCGSGCSGNPIDLNWDFGPLGWGEHHELGHNIQYGRFKMNKDASTEVSNNIFPLSVNIRVAYDKNRFNIPNGSGSGSRTNVQAKLDLMQQAIAEGKTPTEVGLTPADLNFYTTLIFSSGDKFAEWGFEMIPMLYLMSRNIDAERNWTTARDNYGLSLYNYPDEIDDLSFPGNDFMILAVSWLNQLDYRSFFWAWGATWTAKADQQIDAWNLDRKLPNFTYPSNNFTIFTSVVVDFPQDPYARRPIPTDPQTGAASMLGLSALLSVLFFLLALLAL